MEIRLTQPQVELELGLSLAKIGKANKFGNKHRPIKIKPNTIDIVTKHKPNGAIIRDKSPTLYCEP